MYYGKSGTSVSVSDVNVKPDIPDFKPSMAKIFELEHESISKEEFARREASRPRKKFKGKK